LLNRKNGLTFNALLKPGRLKPGEKIIFNGQDISAQLTARDEVSFSAHSPEDIYELGTMPLPPYIKRKAQDSDRVDYQTVYARYDGSVAAPTAGLHFTPELLTAIRAGGVNLAYITLHVGHATFKPVKSEDITAHKMEKEYFTVPQAAEELIQETRAGKGRVIATGTTACRSLEAYAAGNRGGYTDLFIYPGYKFKLVDGLLTNFHLPRTTLFMLVSAFCAAGASASGGAGIGLIKKAYQEAIEKKYRFYSYGDAMLII
jgi:S-adenosylmethionine:tRNA ribosyltransferase-isomerase